jgi:hypothetical protein
MDLKYRMVPRQLNPQLNPHPLRIDIEEINPFNHQEFLETLYCINKIFQNLISSRDSKFDIDLLNIFFFKNNIIKFFPGMLDSRRFQDALEIGSELFHCRNMYS